MKRFIASIMLLSIILLVGCSAPVADTGETQGALPTVAPNEYLACISLTTFNSKEEYDAFIEADGSKLPADFFSWEDAGQFGEVVSMVLLGSGKYLYGIVDETGHNLTMTINRHPKSLSEKMVAEKELTINEDLRKTVNKKGVDLYFKRGEIIYDVSDNGNLYAIIFYMDGVEINITGKLWEYPINRADTLVSKLISADETVANAAFAELMENLSK